MALSAPLIKSNYDLYGQFSSRAGNKQHRTPGADAKFRTRQGASQQKRHSAPALFLNTKLKSDSAGKSPKSPTGSPKAEDRPYQRSVSMSAAPSCTSTPPQSPHVSPHTPPVNFGQKKLSFGRNRRTSIQIPALDDIAEVKEASYSDLKQALERDKAMKNNDEVQSEASGEEENEERLENTECSPSDNTTQQQITSNVPGPEREKLKAHKSAPITPSSSPDPNTHDKRVRFSTIERISYDKDRTLNRSQTKISDRDQDRVLTRSMSLGSDHHQHHNWQERLFRFFRTMGNANATNSLVTALN